MCQKKKEKPKSKGWLYQEEITYKKKEWIVEIFGQRTPIQLFMATLMFWFVLGVYLFGFSIGKNDAYESVKVMIYQITDVCLDGETMTYRPCWQLENGKTVFPFGEEVSISAEDLNATGYPTQFK